LPRASARRAQAAMRDSLVKLLEDSFRHDVIKLLEKPNGNIGVELGVAEGVFSDRMVKSGAFEIFYGIDKYTDKPWVTVEAYKRALRKIGLQSAYRLLRMTFDDAYDLFENESLDFIYVDGYAYTGENGGDIIYKWARKVKIGGVIAGDDYHSDWPLVVKAVDAFVQDSGFELFMTSKVESSAYCGYPSWAVIKSKSTDFNAPMDLVRLGKRRALQYRMKEVVAWRVMSFVRYCLGEDLIKIIKRIRRRG
jgi:Methyltransferase domain